MTTVGELLVLDPAEVAVNRGELDITEWVGAAGPDWGDAALEQQLADAGRQGQTSIDYKLPNRVITIPLTLQDRGDGTFETIRTAIQQKVGLWRAEGGWIKRETPLGPVYADVVGATLKLGGSTMQALQDVDLDAVLTITALPDWYADEASLITTTGMGEIAVVVKTAGDIPGRVRIRILNDTDAVQNTLIWAFRSRFYDPASTAQIGYEAELLTIVSPAISATSTTAYGGAQVQLDPLHLNSNPGLGPDPYDPYWQPLIETTMPGVGDMTHLGTYRVRARVTSWRPHSSASPSVLIRLVWGAGDLSYATANPAAAINTYDNFYLLDLGEIRIDRAPIGTHQWRGRIEAASLGAGMQAALAIYSPGVALSDTNTYWHENAVIDRIWIEPVDDGHGVLSSYPDLSGAIPMTGGAPKTSGADAVLYGSKYAEIRTDGAYRQLASGSAYGAVATEIGDTPRIPASGMENRSVEVFLKTSRGRVDGTASDDGADYISTEIRYRPAYLFTPGLPYLGEEVVGHSLAAGFLLDSPGVQRATALLATYLNTVETTNVAVAGCALTRDNAVAQGGWVTVANSLIRSPARAPYPKKCNYGVVWYGLNDVSQMSGAWNAAAQAQYKQTLRGAISRMVSGAIFDDIDASCTYGDGMVLNSVGTPVYGTGIQNHNTTWNGEVTIQVPADFPGGTVAVHFGSYTGQSSVWNFSVDYIAYGSAVTVNTVGLQVWDGNSAFAFCQRLTGLTPGAHTIRAVVTSVVGAAYFDSWGIEAATPPVVLVPGQWKPTSYAGVGTVPHTPTDADVDALNAAVVSVVAEFPSQVRYVDLTSLNGLTDVEPDGLHPNATGHQRIAALMEAHVP
jgi:hypothetical protein